MGKRVSVGLISTQFAINYGAVLQALSLQLRLRKNPSLNVEVINYYPRGARYGHFERLDLGSLKGFVLSSVKYLNPMYRLARKRKLALFASFLRDNFIFSGEAINTAEDLHKSCQECDAYIVGSDQIWNPRVIDDDIFYLPFAGSTSRKISYAASIGDRLPSGLLTALIDKISHFDWISFREPVQVGEIEERLERKIPVMVDPVFLTSKSEWVKISEQATLNIAGPYVLVYEVNSPPHFKKYVDFLTKQRGINVVEIATRPFPKYTGVKTISHAGPAEFLHLFGNAEYILTSSFHGLAFATIFEKRFSCALNFERSIRQRNLLQRLNLQDREVSDLSELEQNLIQDVDWNLVRVEIEKAVNESDLFLREAFNADS